MGGFFRPQFYRRCVRMSSVRKKMSYRDKCRKAAIQNNICVWCQMKLDTDITVDHLIPVAVYEWTRCFHDKDDNNRIARLIQSRRNIVICCRRCNESKDSKVYTPDELLHRCDSGIDIIKYGELYSLLKDRIQEFNRLKIRKCKEQHGKCKICGCKIFEDSCVLRRKDKSKGKEIDNAVALCRYCSAYRMIHKSYNEFIKNGYVRNGIKRY